MSTQRRSGQERRKQIGDAALRIIGERGLPALTTAAIAEEVGVTSGALFRHFKSRDGILEEAVRRALQKAEASFPPADLPPLERLLTLARNRVRLLQGEPGIAWLLRSDQAYLVLPESAAEELSRLVDRSRNFLLEGLEAGVRDGSIRNDIPPGVLVVLVIGTIHALIRTPGARALAPPQESVDVADVLDALARLLEPR